MILFYEIIGGYCSQTKILDITVNYRKRSRCVPGIIAKSLSFKADRTHNFTYYNIDKHSFKPKSRRSSLV